MMNEWVEVINLLCEKLGIAVDSASLVAEQLVPQLVKMELLSYIVGLAVTLSISIACVVGIVKLWKFKRSDECEWDDEEACLCGIVGCFIICIISSVLVWSYTFEVIEWAVAPDIKVIEYITNMVK
jgi:hypothetical protein